MALSRPWFSDGNIPVADTAQVGRSLMWAIKCFMKGTLGNPTGKGLWTVESSSNGASFSMVAGTDLWTDTFAIGNIVYAAIGTAHSWITMKSPDAMGPVYFQLDCTGNNDNNSGTAMFWASRTAFATGGSLTNRPTSATEWAVHPFGVSPSRVQIWDTVNAGHNHHYTADASGNFWFADSRNGTGHFHFALGFNKLSETRALDQATQFTVIAFDNTNRGALGGSGSGVWTAASEALGRVAGRNHTNSSSAVANSFQLSFPNLVSTISNVSTANVIDGTHDVWPCYVMQNATMGYGIRGRLPDCANVPGSTNGNGAVVGSSQPQSPAPQEQMVVGNLLLPFSVSPQL